MDRETPPSEAECVRMAVEAGLEVHRLRSDGAKAEARALFVAIDRLPWPYDYLGMLVLVGLSDQFVTERQIRARLLVSGGKPTATDWLAWLEGVEDEAVGKVAMKVDIGTVAGA